VRARNIKPGICDNEVLGTADPLYTLLFERLWMIADRRGRLEDRPLRIKAQAFPYRDGVDVGAMLDWLASNGFIARYAVSGTKYIQILAFDKHQSPHKNEQESVIPAMDEQSTAKVVPPENQGSAMDALIPDSGLLIPDSRIADTTRAALPPEFEEFLESTYPQTSHGRNTIAALKRAQGLIGSGRATEFDLRRRLTSFRQFVDSGGYSDSSKVPSMQSWFEPHREDPYWAREWAPIPSKAQRAQDSNIDAAKRWLAGSNA
jgi:hypothetical protein